MSKWNEASQNWAGMNGAEAWAMIDRHSDGWNDTERMMNAWLDANRAPEPSDELARLRAENERLKAGARPYTVTCEPVIDRDWPEAHSVRIRNGGQRFDIGMHLETLEEAEHYATMLRVALGIDAAMTQGKL